MDAQTLIKKLNLVPLPEEGGYYKETFRDAVTISDNAVPHLKGARAASTCIYYLITPEEFSSFHKVKSVEIFHFYGGDPVKMVQITGKGELSDVVIGSDLDKGQIPQVVVPADTWQATKLLPGGQWALLGCTVAPGFDFEDFTAADPDDLAKQFPKHAGIIDEFRRKKPLIQDK